MRGSTMLYWAVVLLCLYGALRFLAGRSIYYPMRYPSGLWEVQERIGAEDVWLETSDGVRIHAWWIPGEGARVATVYFHGNAGNLTHRVEHIAEITQAGSALLLIDYRGYGKSEGRPGEDGLYRDADAAYAHVLERGFTAGQIVAHGESLGCAVAADLASRRECGGVVLEAPFPSAKVVAGRVLPLLGPLLVNGLDTASKIAQAGVPVLVMHGDRDEVIDYELGRRVFEAAREPKTFWTVPGARHNDIVETAGAEYGRRLRAFYAGIGGGG